MALLGIDMFGLALLTTLAMAAALAGALLTDVLNLRSTEHDDNSDRN